MKPRERVIEAFHFREADKVPVDFGGHRSSGIAVQAYKKLRHYLGLKPSSLFIYDVVQQLAVIEDDVLDIIEPDIVQLGYDFYRQPDYWKPWQLHDGTPVMIPRFLDVRVTDSGDYVIISPRGKISAIQKKDCLYFEQLNFPYDDYDGDFSDISEDIKEIMWVQAQTPPGPGSYERIGEIAAKLRGETDRAIYGIFGGNLIETGEMAFRMDDFLMQLALDSQRIHDFLDSLLDVHMKNLEQFVRHVAPYVDIIGFSDDLGMHNGPQISAEMFREFFKFRYKRMYDYIKKHSPHLKICLHCCGSIHKLLPDLIEAGLDSFNPVQISCEHMEPWRLKKDFGDRMVFWGGGCDTREILSRGTPAEVAENVRVNMEAFKMGGGFVFQQVHNILADVPPENIMAMFDAARKYGKY